MPEPNKRATPGDEYPLHEPVESILELVPYKETDRNWRDRAACLDADPEEFLVPGRRGKGQTDPLNLIGKYCLKCSEVTNCLSANLKVGDVTVTVAGGKAVPERRKILKAIRDQQKKLTPLPPSIHSSSGPKDPRWQGIYTKAPSVDPERINQFMEAATPEEIKAIEGALWRKERKDAAG